MSRFGDGIKKPFMDSKTLAIGSIIGAIPIVGILLMGYFVKSLESELKGGKVVKWQSFPELIIESILGTIIAFIYSIPAGVVLFLAVSSLPVGSDYFESFYLALASGNILYYAGLILAIITALVIPMALTNFAKEGKFNAAFDFKKVFRKGLSGQGIIAFLLSIIATIVLGSIVLVVLLTLLTFLGTVPLLALVLVLLASGFINFALASAMPTWYVTAFKEAK